MVDRIIKKEAPPPAGIAYEFQGQAEDFRDLSENMMLALILSIIFVFFVLASLYESFITPVTILLALPPALSGALLALLITRDMLNIFSMIGIVMLMGLVTKNSILLVDFALEGVRTGLSRKEAIYRAGMIRLRPILMTTFAMIAGTLPLALGIGEAAKYRSAMGSAIIGGLTVSTLITLIVVPAVFEYVDRFREFVEKKFRPADIASQRAEVFPEDSTIMQEEFTDVKAVEEEVNHGDKKETGRKNRQDKYK
jgi:hydrophobic/amphiphilic exporter-1 (mainly G- bacteria), HAE1 family